MITHSPKSSDSAVGADDAEREPGPRAPGPVQPGEAEERADQHLALEAMLKIPARSVNSPPSAASRIGLVRRIAETIRPESRISLIARRPSRAWRASHSRIATMRMITAWMTLTSCSGTFVRSCSPRAAGLQRGEEEAADRGEHRVEGGEHPGRQPRPRRARPDDRVVDVAVGLAEHEQRARQPAERAAQRHRDEDRAPHRHAAGLGEVAVEPGHAHRVAERRAAQQPHHRQRQQARPRTRACSGVASMTIGSCSDDGQLGGLGHGRAAGRSRSGYAAR